MEEFFEIFEQAIVYTAICIPYGVIMVVRTNSQEERGVMETWRAVAGVEEAVEQLVRMMGKK